MIGGLVALLLFQLAGEIVAAALELPVPGPVIGMVLLFVVLLVRGETPESWEKAAQGLLKHLSLMFVPAGSGIVTYLALLRQELLPITAALVGSTLITIIVTALTMRFLSRREEVEP
ncbi:MAG: CidA/LrgA family protein [Anaerolineae bacterium]